MLILSMWIAHIVYMISIVLLEVKGCLGLLQVKSSKPCKHYRQKGNCEGFSYLTH